MAHPPDTAQIEAYIKHYGIGLTGGIATGKSSIAGILKSLGFQVFDADQLAHLVMEPGQPCWHEITGYFGQGVLHPDTKQINRTQLGQIVFHNLASRRFLESILHPAIAQALCDMLVSTGTVKQSNHWFYEASLLVETNTHTRFKCLWVTTCSQDTQMKRLLNRNGYTKEQALARMQAQGDPLLKVSLASVVFDTDACPYDALGPAVTHALGTLSYTARPLP